MFPGEFVFVWTVVHLALYRPGVNSMQLVPSRCNVGVNKAPIEKRVVLQQFLTMPNLECYILLDVCLMHV